MTRDPHRVWANNCTCTHTTTCQPCTDIHNAITEPTNREGQ